MIHGDNDQIQPYARAQVVAELTGAELVTIAGRRAQSARPLPGQVQRPDQRFPRPQARHSCAGQEAAQSRSASPGRRSISPRPSALGHGRRDIAITRELRKLHPDLQVDWLAQDPVTRLLEANGERIHPLSARLASESRHIELEFGRARSQRLPGHPPHGRGADRQLHDLPGCGRRGRLRPRDRRRGLGHRPLLARAPGAEAGQARLVHRLRRLRADAVGWRARGVPDRPTTTPR